ncbi:hypothetical protein Scep_002134 [Stephania cephalantha]|uniref:Uncharacterized protein n=1 Tax=Stephania cephalantha TaxID=152367 RepID=A0AAP0Q4P2_9MAGN
MKLSSHLREASVVGALASDLDVEDEDYEEERDLEFVKARGRDLRSRNRSLHRRAKSMSPMRNPPFQWNDEEDEEDEEHRSEERETRENTEISEQKDGEINESSSAEEATPSVSASSSTVISLRPPLTLSASRTTRPRLSHLILHLANAQMRLQTPPDPIDSLNPSVLIRFRRGLLSNYSSWCSYLGQKSKIWLPEPNPRSADLRRELLSADLRRELLSAALYHHC